MKFKFIQVLVVCVITVLILSPELVVFSMVWERHIELVQPKSFICETEQSRTIQVGSNSTSAGKNSYQDKSDVHSATNFVNPSLTTIKQYKIVNIIQWFFVLFPIFLGILVFLYDRYLIYRAAVFQQQVEMLEKLWQSIEQ